MKWLVFSIVVQVVFVIYVVQRLSVQEDDPSPHTTAKSNIGQAP